MAKDQSFAAKLKKGDTHQVKCPDCGNTYTILKVVSTEKSELDTYKFKENMVAVCKCNEKEVYG